MAAHNEAKCKKCRRSRVKLYLKGARCETAKCAIEKRNVPPGYQGGIQRKLSEYGIRLREKQKLRFFYGMSESQSVHYMEIAHTNDGATGDNMLQICESRLDNFIYRVKLASSRRQARQLIRHGHFKLNGRKASIPSMMVRPGDGVAAEESSLAFVKPRFEGLKDAQLPEWVKFDGSSEMVSMSRLPQREEIDTPVDIRLVVEYYAR